MMIELDIDPALFGVWERAPVYDGLARDGQGLDGGAGDLGAVLDTKAQISPLDDLQDMLNGMTKELRQQLQQFRLLREETAGRALAGLEETDRKQTQADAKASIEAMSVIVRTLEKIDSLQRTIAHDRQRQAEQELDEDGYRALVARFEARIDERARERDNARVRARLEGERQAAAGIEDAGPAKAAGPS